MNQEELTRYEGKIVCFFHRESEKYPNPSRWTRGVVYQGICYDLLTISKKSEIPSIQLQPVKTEYIAEIFSLKKRQQTLLERRVCNTLARGETQRVLVSVPLYLETYRESKEKSKDPTP